VPYVTCSAHAVLGRCRVLGLARASCGVWHSVPCRVGAACRVTYKTQDTGPGLGVCSILYI
jgi:hypothetical protein